MRWSQLKHQVEERLAESVANRIAVHQARYRHSGEELGRVWITLDGEEIADFSTTKGLRAQQELTEELWNLPGMRDSLHPGQTERYGEAQNTAHELNRKAGILTDQDALRQLEEYLSLPIDSVLASDSPLLRALGYLDKRTGKRRLKLKVADQPQHPLVNRAWQVRCAAEGLQIDTQTAG